MSAAHHLNSHQLRLFMSAQELHDTPSIDVPLHEGARLGGHWKTMDAMRATKRKENRKDGLDKHIAKHGVHEPVDLAVGGQDLGDTVVVANGHHRAVAAFDANPQSYVPVTYEDYGAPRPHWTPAMQEEHDVRVSKIPDWNPTNRFPSYP